MSNTEKLLQQILENQISMQNQMNGMQDQFGGMQNQFSGMQKKIGDMQNQIDSNHKEVVSRLDKLEQNQSAFKTFILNSDNTFKKSEEAYEVIEDLRRIFTK